ncbi:MAG: hypothetical protein MZV70_73420 [Desulfobacterales bacterium]|nr:hypothetical protein [Desulfobacterales bacterium]
MGLLTYNNPYGRSIHEPSKEYAKAKNIEIVCHRGVPAPDRGPHHRAAAPQAEGRPVRVHADAARRHHHAPSRARTASATTPCSSAPGPPRTRTSSRTGKGLIQDRVKMQFCGGLPVGQGAGHEGHGRALEALQDR